ncbi:MAG: hypothetical protein L0Z62_00350 [Gemmataceae bacterium]|nr:hypothetical protein [Gemmataceae bacterium]
MSRLHYFAALVWLAASGFILAVPTDGPGPVLSGVRVVEGAEGWFRGIKSSCNQLEVDLALRNNPPPGGLEGTGYAAACLAIAGRIDVARGRLQELAPDQRWKAVAIVFEIGHPIADAGDDRSAGPIMGLVVEFWPNHYMALYHAGMAHYAVGDAGLARRYLTDFLRYYESRDGWRSNALAVLGRLGS